MAFKYNQNLAEKVKKNPINVLPRIIGFWGKSKLYKETLCDLTKAIFYMKEANLSDNQIKNVFVEKYGENFGKNLYNRYLKKKSIFLVGRRIKNGK